MMLIASTPMSDYGFAIYGGWLFGYAATVLSQSMWFAIAVVLIIAHGTIWAADHAFDTPNDMMTDFQVWFTFAVPIGAFVALALLNARRWERAPIDVDSVTARPPRHTTVDSIGIVTFVFAVLALVAGINALLQRYSINGMSPIMWDETSEYTFGVVMTIIGSIGLFVAIWMLCCTIQCSARRTAPGPMSVKFLFVLAFLVSRMAIHDSLIDDLPRWVAGFLVVPGLVVGYALMYVIAYYVESSDDDRYYDRAYESAQFTMQMAIPDLFALILVIVMDNIAIDGVPGNIQWVYLAVVIYSAIAIAVIELVKNSGGYDEAPEEQSLLASESTAHADTPEVVKDDVKTATDVAYTTATMPLSFASSARKRK